MKNIRYLTMQSTEPAHKFMALWKFLFFLCIFHTLVVSVWQQQATTAKPKEGLYYLAFFVD